jgi:hypothetical protein
MFRGAVVRVAAYALQIQRRIFFGCARNVNVEDDNLVVSKKGIQIAVN